MKNTILNKINSSLNEQEKMIGSFSKGKCFLVATIFSVEASYKTKKGAENWIERKSSFSYYDDYNQELCYPYSKCQVVEIKESEVVGFNDYNLWFEELKTYMGRPYQVSNIDWYKKYVTDENVLTYIKENVKSIKENKGVFIPENLLKVEETEVTEEVEIVEEVQPMEETSKIETIEDVRIVLNEDKNGVEIYFSGKPDEDVRNNLKSNGFRWSKFNKCWYAKQSEATLNFANSITNTTEEEIKRVSDEYKEEKEKEIENKLNELDINDIETYAIDENLSRRENESYLFRSKHINHTKEIQDYFLSVNNEVLSVLENCNDKTIEYNLKMALQRFKRDYHANYVSRLQNKASNPSWLVTGRQGRSASKDQKMNNRYDNLLLKANEIVDKFNKSVNRAKSEMKKQNKQEVEDKINNTNVEDYEFTRCKKEYNLNATNNIFSDPNRETTMTNYNNEYFIFKNWGKYRIYNSKGIEIAGRNSLKDAKKYLIMILKSVA